MLEQVNHAEKERGKMSIIGIGTIINKDNWYKYQNSLISHLNDCRKGMLCAITPEQLKKVKEKTKFKFINPLNNTSYIAQLIAIDFDYANETRFISYDGETIRFESCIEPITEIEFVMESDNDNRFITNNEEFAYGWYTSLMYEVIKEKHKREDMQIGNLNLSTRTKRCLINNNINNIYDLENFSEKDLKHIRNLGQKSIAEIKDKLKEHGLSLRENEEENK